jgi:hypothetical protein
LLASCIFAGYGVQTHKPHGAAACIYLYLID